MQSLSYVWKRLPKGHNLAPVRFHSLIELIWKIHLWTYVRISVMSFFSLGAHFQGSSHSHYHSKTCKVSSMVSFSLEESYFGLTFFLWIMNLVIVSVILKCMHSSMSKKCLLLKLQIQPWVTHALCYLNSIYFHILIILCIILVEILSKNYEFIKFEYNN
jgi:hypothetical protein